MPAQLPVRVVVHMDYADPILDGLREVSPHLHIERHFPTVPDRAWAEAEILYTRDTLPTAEQAPRLRWVQLHTAGVDHLLGSPMLKEGDARGVQVTTASGVHVPQMPEFVLALILAFNYRLPALLALQAQRAFSPVTYQTFGALELRGQTLGIVGYGTIGRALARLADGLGMRVLAAKRDAKRPAQHDMYAPPETGDPEGTIPARLYPPEAVRTMAAECDYLAVLAPLTPTSAALIDAGVLAAMKPTAVLVNVARGGVVDETALIAALRDGTIAGAALDVFVQEPLPPDHPLWGLSNVIITPHIAGNSVRYHRKTADVFAENLRRYLDGRPLLNRVERERGY
jgi:phosphoglycerate dehydrogenase-like enzyme